MLFLLYYIGIYLFQLTHGDGVNACPVFHAVGDEQRVAADAELLGCLQGDAADGGIVLHDLSCPGIDLTELFCTVGTYKQPSFVEIQVVRYIFISQLPGTFGANRSMRLAGWVE